jgi:riboflavin kinase/FMN adenylyltransferase
VRHQITVSSTRIREALLAADLQTANEYLGYDYFFEGLVVDGNKLGRTLGYPTANLEVQSAEKLVPGDGIYVVKTGLINQKPEARNQLPSVTNHQDHYQLFSGMMSIGLRPTIANSKRVIEVNIFDFNENIYGKILRVYVTHYMRAEVKFKNLEELKLQLDEDRRQALSVQQ